MKRTENPFPVISYKGPEYFCDREEETKLMTQAISAGRSITLYSIRRLGKTGLIHHVLNKFARKRNFVTVYMDIYDTSNINEFINRICSQVIFALERKSENFIKTLTKFFGRFRPKITLDPISGQPSLELDIQNEMELKLSLETLMRIIKEQKKNVVIAIDEFQQINFYENLSLAASLRQYIQDIDKLSIIFSGSQRQLLLEMFSSPKHALFRTTQMLPLEKIKFEAYRDHIQFHFKQGLKKIPINCIEDILKWTRIHTYYTQYVCHRLYEKSGKQIKQEDVDSIKIQIIKENETMFQSYRRLLSPHQWKLLKAIGKDAIVKEPTSKYFIQKHDLGSHSTVRLSLKYLENNDLIYSDIDPESDKILFQVYDVFLAKWLEAL